MAQRKTYYDDGSLQREIARAYEVIAACKQVLEQSRPDTFLGRQRHEPIQLNYDQDEPPASSADRSRRDYSSFGDKTA